MLFEAVAVPDSNGDRSIHAVVSKHGLGNQAVHPLPLTGVCPMPTFIRLASLTEQGIKNIQNFQHMLGEAREIMEQHGVKLVEGWATLGDYDVVAVIEAPDAKTAAQVSALIASRGNFRAKTLSAVPISELSNAIQDGD